MVDARIGSDKRYDGITLAALVIDYMTIAPDHVVPTLNPGILLWAELDINMSKLIG